MEKALVIESRMSMLNLPTVKGNLGRYVDAGFPILYIYTFDEAEADRYISSIAGRKKVVEWNGANGFADFKTKVHKIADY